jgi:hypothetical protein
VPAGVRELLLLNPAPWLRPLLRLYPVLARLGLRAAIQRLLMPADRLGAVRALDYHLPHTDGSRSPAYRPEPGPALLN